LGRNPEVQRKIFEEITHAGFQGQHIQFKDLEELPYTNAVQKEVSRMFPTAPFVTREFDKDILIGGYRIPKEVCDL
jgi:cytochrome P450